MLVLVTYATRYGSTRSIAERIAAGLGERVNGVDVKSLDDVNDLEDYDAIVLGSAVYNGSWIPEANAFVHRNRAALEKRPVWLFSVGAFGDRHRVIGRLMKKEPREIDAVVAAIHPRDYRVFAGVIEPERWSTVGGLILRAFGGHLGDNRDWPDIDAWAEAISRELQMRAATAA
jgi:menaquinone-dependent protoporphyrinogen oxidase